MSSNYIIDREPMRFGGNQASYLERRNAVIASGVNQIRKGGDLQQLFFTLLADYAKERSEIAVDNHTEKAHYFGTRRMDCLAMLESTPLGNPYCEYNDKMFLLFETLLKGKIPLFGDLVTKKFVKEEPQSFFEVGLFTQRDLREREWHQFTPVKLKEVIEDQKPFELGAKVDEIEEKQQKEDLALYNTLLKSLKENYFFLYEHRKINCLLNIIPGFYQKLLPRDQNRLFLYSSSKIFVRGEMSIEVNRKKVPLSEYFFITYQDGQTDPAEKMKAFVVTVLHQDRFLIDETLKEIAVIFERAIQSDPSKLDDLKTQVALIRYLFAHAMPYIRGSAAIGEWIETTIYKYHGYVCTYNPATMGDLEALTNLWSTFRNEKYDSTIQLKK